MRTKEEIYKKIIEIEDDIKNIDCKLKKEHDLDTKVDLYKEKSDKQIIAYCLCWALGIVDNLWKKSVNKKIKC